MNKYKIIYTDPVTINKKLIVEAESMKDALLSFLTEHPEANDYSIEVLEDEAI